MMRKIISVAVMFAIVFSFATSPVFAEGGVMSGSGTAEDPFIVEDCDDLVATVDTITYATTLEYHLGANIDCTAQGAMSSLFGGQSFEGVFDGENFSITGLTIEESGFNPSGLFSYAQNAEFRDLTLAGTITGTNNSAGGLLAIDIGGTTINNVDSDFVINMAMDGNVQFVGGLVGKLDGGSITNSTVEASISISGDSDRFVTNVGGIAGDITNGTLTDSSSIGTIEIENLHTLQFIGGLAGKVEATDVSNTSSNVDILVGTVENPLKGAASVGGLIGGVDLPVGQTFTNNTTDQEIVVLIVDDNSGDHYGQFVGGLVGYFCSANDFNDCIANIDDSHTTSNISVSGADGAFTDVGGAVGLVVGANVDDFSAEGNVTVSSDSAQFVGGLFGQMKEATLTNSHYIGIVTADVTDATNPFSDVGGLIGATTFDFFGAGAGRNSISDSYAVGDVLIGQNTPNNTFEFAGGFVGLASDGLNVSSSYALMDVTVDANEYIQAVGGFVGYMETDNTRDYDNVHDNNYYYGDLDVEVNVAESMQFIGGYVGRLAASGDETLTISNVFTGGTMTMVNATESGGFVGFIDGSNVAISNAYSSSLMSNTDVVGGFLGSTFDTPAISNSFSAATIDAAAGSGAFAATADTSIFTNVYYDGDAAGGLDCVSGELAFAECTEVNGDGNSPDYFKNNSINAPLDGWDFAGEDAVWATFEGNNPYLANLRNPYILLGDVSITVNDQLNQALDGVSVEITCGGIATTVTDGQAGDDDGLENGVVVFAAGGEELADASCDDGDTITTLDAFKEGYILAEATGDFFYNDNIPNNNSTVLNFGQKVTVTREGDNAALSGATVTAGSADTACVEDGVTGIYYCPVPEDEDGTENDILVQKTGYANNSTGDTGDRENFFSDQAEVAVSGVKFQLKVILKDELGNTVPANALDVVQYNGEDPDYTSDNTAYWAVSATRATLAVEEAGFIDSQITNSSLDASGSTGVTTLSAFQTVITFEGDATSSTSANNAEELTIAATVKGMQYMLKSYLLQSETGGNITGIEDGSENEGNGEPSADVDINVEGGATIVASAVSSDVIYIAMTGDGGGDDAFSVGLTDVTVDDGQVNGTSFVTVEFADTGNLINDAGRQWAISIGPEADGDFEDTTGFLYPLKVVLADELGNELEDVDTVTYGGFPPYYSSGNVAYIGQYSGGAVLAIEEDGYVAGGATNEGLANVGADGGGQTVVNLGDNDALDDAIVARSTVNIKGLQFGHKVVVQDENEESLTGATVTAADEACTEDGETGQYYCVVALAEDGVEDGVTVVLAGYQDGTATLEDRAAAADEQVAYTVTLLAEEEENNNAGGSGGGGGSSRKSVKIDKIIKTEEPAIKELSYEEALKMVRELGLVQKEMAVSSNKCETLMIMSRALAWDYDTQFVGDDGFTDTPAWCDPVAKYAKDSGLVKGRSENVLGLDSPLTRFEFVVILYKTMEGKDDSAAAQYPDFIVDWAEDAVNWAKAVGYMGGFGDGTFGGIKGILKQDVGVTLLRIKLQQENVSGEKL